MNLRKIVTIEITVIVVVIAIVLLVVEGTPYFVSSSSNSSIGVYNQKEFAKGTETLGAGQTASAQFNYSSFDPAILVIDLTFQNWQNPGRLSMYCNGRNIATIFATPDNPTVRLTMISTSGWDWVKPPSINSYTYGNEVSFVSETENGYAGTFSYQIDIRGSK